MISLGVIIFGEAGLISAFRTSQHKAQIEARIENIVRENRIIQAKVDGIRTNVYAMEHAIRKSLSLVAPDEILIQFRKDETR